MKKDKTPADDLRPEYDFAKMKGGVRGKYTERFRTGTNLVAGKTDDSDNRLDRTADSR
jgi:hypothetical protein